MTEIQSLVAKTVLAAVERLAGSIVTFTLRERILSASLVTLNGWLSEIVLKDSLDSILSTDQSGESEPGT